MKKLLIILPMLAIILTGCNNYVDHPISGHYYINYNNSENYFKFHFLRNGHFEDIIKLKGKETIINQLKWTIEGDNVLIWYNNSTVWDKETRGTLWTTLKYDAKENAIILGDEVKYTFYK